MNRLFEERVTLEPVQHRYWHKDGREFASLSRVRSVIAPDTDFDAIAGFTAKSRGVSKAEIQAEWKKKNVAACDTGTLIHDALEMYGKKALIEPANEWLRPMILSVSKLEIDYYAVHRELCLYDEDEEIAMTADRVMESTKHKASIIDLDDYKTNLSKGITYTCKYKNYLKPPFDHLQNSNYFDYSLQLSCEAMTLQKLTGRKIGKLTITYIPPNNPLAWRTIPVAFMKFEAQALFKYYRELKHIKKEEGDLDRSSTAVVETMPNFG